MERYEIAEIKSGIGAVIINPEGQFLAVRENHSRKDNRKMRGMWSHPMETIDKGESHEQAMQRLIFGEEVKGVLVRESRLTNIYLASIQISPGIWLYDYLLHTESNEFSKGYGSDITEIRWANTGEVLEAPIFRLSREEAHLLPDFLDSTIKDWISRYLNQLIDDQRVSLGSLIWRPGVRETLHTYKIYREDPSVFVPASYPQTIDDFPPEIILEEYIEEDTHEELRN